MDGSSKAFHAFLTNLSRNPAARAAYSADPAGVMAAAGLTQEQIIAVLSQDPSKIEAQLIGPDSPTQRPRLRVTVIIHVGIEF